MLVIRLTRTGKKNQPSYRVVVTEKTNPVKGKFLEILGHYTPRLKQNSLDVERVKYWISKGAQVSDTVHNLLVNEKVIDKAKVKAWRPKKKTQEANKAKAVAEAEASKAKEEAPAEKKEEVLAEEVASTSAEATADKPAEEAKEEEKAEVPAEEVKEEVKTE